MRDALCRLRSGKSGRSWSASVTSMATAMTAAVVAVNPSSPAGVEAGAPDVSLPPPVLRVEPITLAARSPGPRLGLALSADPVRATVGQPVELRVTVVNSGTAAAEGVTVALPVTEGVSALPGAGLLGDREGWTWSVMNDGTWLVFDKDGTVYEFGAIKVGSGYNYDGVGRWAFTDASGGCSVVEPYRFMLRRVTDAFRVVFTAGERSSIAPAGAQPHQYDMVWDYAVSQARGAAGAPHEHLKLDAVTVQAMPASTWQTLREYRLGYSLGLSSDGWTCTAGPCDYGQGTGTYGPSPYKKLTLTRITRVGSAGQTLPDITMAYNTANRGTGKHPNGGWARLSSTGNGQGGTVSFDYDNIAQTQSPARFANLFTNLHRVRERRVGHGRGNTYETVYTYEGAPMNWLARSDTEYDSSNDPCGVAAGECLAKQDLLGGAGGPGHTPAGAWPGKAPGK